MWRTLRSILNVSPKSVPVFLKSDRVRSCAGMDMISDAMRTKSIIHHFAAHTGTMMSMSNAMKNVATMRMERGIRACCMVLSM